MTLRRRIAIEPMTAESFAPFGGLLESSAMPDDHRVMTPSQFECDGRATIHTIWQPRAGRSFSKLERHFGVTQTFFQLSGSPVRGLRRATHGLRRSGRRAAPRRRAGVSHRPRQGVLVRPRHLALARSIRARPAGGDVRDPQRRPESDPDRRLPGRDLAPIRESRRRPATDTHRGRHRTATGIRALRWASQWPTDVNARRAAVRHSGPLDELVPADAPPRTVPPVDQSAGRTAQDRSFADG